MPIDASIYQAFAPRQRGALEYAQDFAGLDASRQALDTGAIQQQSARETLAEQQRTRQRASALEQLMGSMAGKSDAAVLQGLRGAGRFNEAGAMEKGILERQKLGVDIGKDRATTVKTMEDAAKDALIRYRGALDFVDTPQGAQRWLQAQYADPLLSQHMQSMGPPEQAMTRIPQTPQEFAQWRQQAGMGMEKFIANQTTQRGQDVSAATAAAGQQVTRETAAQTDARIKAEGAANRGVQMRGQNMTDARSRQALEESGGASAPPALGVPRPTVLPWANQSRATDANKVKAEEAKRGAKEVEKDEDGARAAAAAAADAKRFIELNAATSSGGASKVGAVRAVRGAFSSDAAEMEGITARLAPNMRPPGSGATSDYDAKMFERGTVGLDKPKATNDAIAAGIIARAQQSQDYALFRQTYLEQNGTLQGADRYWKSYVQANPIFDPKAKTPTINKGRAEWRDYFGGAAPNGAAPAKPSATPAAVAGGFRYLGTE